MRIVYDGLVLSDSFPVPDADGCTWMVTAMSGWESMPTRQGSIDYTMRHGGVVANPTYGPKSLGLTGMTKAPTEEAFWKAYNLLLGMSAALGVGRPLTVQEDVEKEVVVMRGAEPRFRIKPGHFEWELSFTAMDPLKYGPPVTTTLAAGATKNIINPGTIASPHVTIKTTGAGMLGVRNNETGVRTFSRVAMSSGTVIDQRARTIYLGTENRHFQLSPASSWWMLEPGLNPIVNDGTAPVSITYRPAWA